MKSNPVISIVMGDPAGIGPELIVKLLGDASLSERCRPFLIGDLQVMRNTAAALESPALPRDRRTQRRLFRAGRPRSLESAGL